MPLTPGYGETPLPHDELDALLPEVIEILDNPITRADVYDLEQGAQDQVVDELMPAALDGSLPLHDLLSNHFVRDLHTRLFRPIWVWAGRQRQLEGNIGVAPEQIAVELRNSLGTIAWRWEHTSDWTARQLGIVVHAETVRIHPFLDGNGRTTKTSRRPRIRRRPEPRREALRLGSRQAALHRAAARLRSTSGRDRSGGVRRGGADRAAGVLTESVHRGGCVRLRSDNG